MAVPLTAISPRDDRNKDFAYVIALLPMKGNLNAP